MFVVMSQILNVLTRECSDWASLKHDLQAMSLPSDTGHYIMFS